MSENNAKKKMSFGEIWQKFGTIGIFVLLLIILAVIKPDSVFNSSSVPQILHCKGRRRSISDQTGTGRL